MTYWFWHLKETNIPVNDDFVPRLDQWLMC